MKGGRKRKRKKAKEEGEGEGQKENCVPIKLYLQRCLEWAELVHGPWSNPRIPTQ